MIVSHCEDLTRAAHGSRQPHTGVISHINFERASNARIVSGINENIKDRGRFLTQHTHSGGGV